MNDDLLWRLRSRMEIMQDKIERDYKTIDLLKKAAKKQCFYQVHKPIPSILDAINEAAWISYRQRVGELQDMIDEINKERGE